ncbi:MAG: ankyrin repeat domain-containing protein [Rickettsiales bacterium]
MDKLYAKYNYSEQDVELIEAVASKEFELVKEALDSGANPNLLFMPDGSPILHEAVAGGNIEIIKLLLSYGAEINGLNSSNQSVLHFLGTLGEVDLFNFFIERGIDQSIVDNQGNTAADYVIEYNCHDATINSLNTYSMTVDDIEDNAESEESVILNPGASINIHNHEGGDFQQSDFGGVGGMFFHQSSW